MSFEIQPRTQVPPGDPVQEIIEAQDDFVRAGARNILDRSVLDQSSEVIWIEDDDSVGPTKAS